MTRTRLGGLALALAGVLFVLYPAVRPWHDESTVDGAVASLGSGAWVASHLFAMLGFLLVPLGLLAFAPAAAVTTWIGAGLTLPYYGAEDFGLNAVGRRAGAGDRFDVLALVDAVRYGPVAATMFAVGLLTLAVGAILAAVAVWRSGTLPRWAGVPFALGFALFIPQFYAPAAVRIAHGVLLGAGLVWLGVTVGRAAPRSVPAAAGSPRSGPAVPR